MAQSLEGGIVSRTTQQKFPKDSWLIRWGKRKPYLGFFLLAVFPHFLGSVVNISYNSLRIIGKLEDPQQTAFVQLVLIYNSVVYPICLGLLVWLIHRVMKLKQSLNATDDFVEIRGRSARSQILLLPKRAALLACLGWLPGALFFPVGIGLLSKMGVEPEIYYHFVISFTFSGLIALTYSFLGLACLSLGAFYSRMFPEPGEFPFKVNEELKSQAQWLSFFKILAGLIPLAAASIFISVSSMEGQQVQFKVLAVSLILLSGIGFQFADRVVSRLTNKIHILRDEGK